MLLLPVAIGRELGEERTAPHVWGVPVNLRSRVEAMRIAGSASETWRRQANLGKLGQVEWGRRVDEGGSGLYASEPSVVRTEGGMRGEVM